MHSRTHCGLYPQLGVSLASGLPTAAEWARVQTDAAMAATTVRRELQSQVAAGARSDAAVHLPLTQQRGRDIYSGRIYSLGIEPLQTIGVEVRFIGQVGGAKEASARRIVHARVFADALTPSCLVTRLSIDLSENAQAAGPRPFFECSQGEVLMTVELRSFLSLATALPCGSVFMQLAARPGVTVQRVCKGTVGPFSCEEIPTPPPFSPLLKGGRGSFAAFSIEEAAPHAGCDASNDPLRHLMVEDLPVELPLDSKSMQAEPGCKIYRDCKFVADPATQPAIERLCRDAGTRNIIYTAAAGAAISEGSA
jgi:hypothetical protein